MQTFLPYASFVESARALDRQRLGKQRVECFQLLRAMDEGGGWSRHPAALMWTGHSCSLAHYGLAICEEWVSRGYIDNTADRIRPYAVGPNVPPPWLGDEAFHASHRSNLLRKDPQYYGSKGWTEPNDLPYVWPTNE